MMVDILCRVLPGLANAERTEDTTLVPPFRSSWSACIAAESLLSPFAFSLDRDRYPTGIHKLGSFNVRLWFVRDNLFYFLNRNVFRFFWRTREATPPRAARVFSPLFACRMVCIPYSSTVFFWQCWKLANDEFSFPFHLGWCCLADGVTLLSGTFVL